MGAYVWPVDNWQSADTSKYTGRKLRQMLGAVLIGKTAARPLGARSGVAAGTPSSTVTVSGSTWTVKPHSGVLDVETSAIAGPYWYSLDANTTGTVSAANATQARVDLLVVQVSDPTEADGTATPGIAVVYVAGTPGAGVPATPARSMVLAQINVPVSGGGASTVTWVAPVTVATGGIMPTAGAAYYPASPYVGQYIDDPALGGLARWNGSAWQARLPVLGSASGTYNGTSAGNLTLTHNLPFTPSRVFVQSTRTTPASDPIFAIGVDSLTSTTFRVRLATFVNQAGNNYYVALGGIATTGLTYSVDFLAFP